MSGCPDRPQSERPEHIGFAPQPMVRWFDPVQLIGTAFQVVLSGIFGAYSDKREIQAALAPGAVPDEQSYASGEELWLDYVADLGDGFEPTYTIAYLLSRPALTAVRGDQKWETERGRILVMGGDQVYPTARREEYENRLIGPYRAALPCTLPAESPHLYAIPGNHDWYDGLTSFVRFFCQRRYIGGWWLWAIDIQFDAYIDDPQLAYFRAARRRLLAGDRVVLATSKPSWIKGPGDHSYENLRFFAKEMIAGTGATLAVTVAGDLHHYCRYQERGGSRQKITSGGGGAYLYPTHHLKPSLTFDEPGEGGVTFELRDVYPAKEQSERLRWRAGRLLAVRNVRFLRVVAALYFVLALLIQIPVRRALLRSNDVWTALPTSKWTALAAGLLVLVLTLFAAPRNIGGRFALGAAHALSHVILLALVVALLATALSGAPGDLRGWWWALVVAGGAALLACFPGSCLLGLYLSLCDRFGDRLERHTNEAFACQAIEGWKNFLRLHIDREGTLTIYPLGVDRVLRRRDLALNEDGAPGDPFFRPKDGVAVPVRLLEEKPVRIGAPGAAA
ncbi:MAG: metallophosphoesterase [Thermoleophilia bacterium]|nr:metallophosphoesterase [Thermoleophilia bacterium]